MNYASVDGLIMGALLTGIAITIFKFWPRKEENVWLPYTLYRTDINQIDSAMRSFSDELWDRYVDFGPYDDCAVRAWWLLVNCTWFKYDNGTAAMDLFPEVYMGRFDKVEDFVHWRSESEELFVTAVEYDNHFEDTKHVYVFRGCW